MRIAIALMATAAIVWLGYEFSRLLWLSNQIWASSPPGAVDLNLRYNEVHTWLATGKVTKPYLPASYAMLWPFLGWLPFTPAKWLWAATTVAALAWLVRLIIKESNADTALERLFVALIPLSMYATGATVGNGQLIVLILPLLIAGILLLKGRQHRWQTDLIAAALVLMALVKPNVSVPFLWIVVLVPGTLRPALLVLIGYLALTLFVLCFPEMNLSDFFSSLFVKPISAVSTSTGWGASVRYSDLPTLLKALGLKRWTEAVTFVVLVLLGVWIYRHRRGDIWLLLGVTAIVARVLTYHRWYDDLLILIPMVCLFRIAKQVPNNNSRGTVAGILLAVTMLFMMAPGGLYLLPPPFNVFYAIGQTILWIILMIFLIDTAWRENDRKI